MQPLVPLVFHNLPSLYPLNLEEMIFYTCIYIVRTSSSQCACVTCARFYLGVSLLYEYQYRSSAKGKRERVSCPRICASSSVVRPRKREATETAEEMEAS